MEPLSPIYIVSKGRHESRLTSRTFEMMGVPYRVVIEEQEFPLYASVIDPKKLLILDPEYQRKYDAFADPKDSKKSKGSGPARNFAWEHSISIGAEKHWVVDDNIRYFYRLNRNLKVPVADGTIFRCMEDFCNRYKNVAMAGPQYDMFAPRKTKMAPFILNTRIFSCNLIRNDVPFRWRGRYNEDADLSIRMLKAGWCTILFNAFLQGKRTTQLLKGGNTTELYAHGTLPKSRMLLAMHPDIVKLVWRYGRWHHHLDLSAFKNNPLQRKDSEIASAVDNYGMELVTVKPGEAKLEPCVR